MMLVLSILILATLLLSFYSVDEVTTGVTQALSGTVVLYGLAALVAVWVAWTVWKKRLAAAKVQQDGATH